VLFFFQAEDGIRDRNVTGVQTCALPISRHPSRNPIVRLPQSPRKIEAGLKLYRRNASRAPTRGAVASARVAFCCRRAAASVVKRSEERRVGKEGRSRWGW